MPRSAVKSRSASAALPASRLSSRHSRSMAAPSSGSGSGSVRDMAARHGRHGAELRSARQNLRTGKGAATSGAAGADGREAGGGAGSERFCSARVRAQGAAERPGSGCFSGARTRPREGWSRGSGRARAASALQRCRPRARGGPRCGTARGRRASPCGSRGAAPRRAGQLARAARPAHPARPCAPAGISARFFRLTTRFPEARGPEARIRRKPLFGASERRTGLRRQQRARPRSVPRRLPAVAAVALGASRPAPGAPRALGSARRAFGAAAALGAAAPPELRSAMGAWRASALVPRERRGTVITESGELNVHIYLLKKIIYICSKALPSLKDKHHLVTKLKK